MIFLITHFPYWIAILFMITGLYIVMAQGNLVKKIVGLNIFQISVFLLYIMMAKVSGGTAPILEKGIDPSSYSNPLPHVLILTAIVVGIATTSVAYALTIRIKEAYGNIEEQDIYEKEANQNKKNMARWAYALRQDKMEQAPKEGGHH